MSRYKNTITLDPIFSPPKGAQARAWDAFRAEYPQVDGARITSSGSRTGPYMSVQIERTMGTAAERVAIVTRLADAFAATVQVMPMTWAGHGKGSIAWVLVTYHGQQICVETSVCSCHPDGEQS
jgi:hypothetical protein